MLTFLTTNEFWRLRLFSFFLFSFLKCKWNKINLFFILGDLVFFSHLNFRAVTFLDTFTFNAGQVCLEDFCMPFFKKREKKTLEMTSRMCRKHDTLQSKGKKKWLDFFIHMGEIQRVTYGLYWFFNLLEIRDDAKRKKIKAILWHGTNCTSLTRALLSSRKKMNTCMEKKRKEDL